MIKRDLLRCQVDTKLDSHRFSLRSDSQSKLATRLGKRERRAGEKGGEGKVLERKKCGADGIAS